MRRLLGSALLVSVCLASAATATASATPALPRVPRATATDSDPDVTYQVDTGRFTRTSTTGTTVTITITAPEHGDCNAGVYLGTAAQFIASGANNPTTPVVDLPGSDAITSISSSVRGVPYYPEIPQDQLSPVRKSAPLADGKYTVIAYCGVITDDGETDYTSDLVNKYFLDEFTLPAVAPSNPIRFGSS